MKLGSLTKKLRNPDYLLRKTSEVYREVTSPLRLEPTFLIIGVQKGGTSSLYEYLIQHAQIAPALVKEVHFFDNHTRAHNFGKGMIWYRSHFAYSFQNLFLSAERSLTTGEATPDYLFDPNAPQRVAKYLPSAKLILLLRNPVDRAYSHYLHNVRASATYDPGREPLSFEDAIAQEDERLKGEQEKLLQDSSYFSYNYSHYSYLSKGIYIKQLEKWLEFFSKEQILILKSEDFFENPPITFAQVLEFLGLQKQALTDYTAYNTREKSDSSLSESTRRYLVSHFEPYNQSLYQLTGEDFGWNF
ncbi:MAG: sulfotransferase domain-containing protein [Microcoleaceae cyanobacterium]